MNTKTSELLNILNDTHTYEPLKHITYRSTLNDLIVVAVSPALRAQYVFELTSDQTLIKATGTNYAGIKVTMYTKTELLHGRRIAPDLILGLSTLFNFDFRFTAEVVASEARVRIKRVRVASEATRTASDAQLSPQQSSSSFYNHRHDVQQVQDCISQSPSRSVSPSRSHFVSLLIRIFFGKHSIF